MPIVYDSRRVFDGQRDRTAEPITFEPGSDELSDRGVDIVKAVVAVILNTPTIREVAVLAHTDAREADAGGLLLSDERAGRVADRMLYNGMEEGRVLYDGLGHRFPPYRDSDCLEPAEDQVEMCKEAMRLNRSVEFRIWRRDAPVPREILGPRSTSALPLRLLQDAGGSAQFPVCRPWARGLEKPIPCVLPMKPAVLRQGTVLENAKDAKGMLPKGGSQILPREGVLPAGGEPPKSPAE